MPINNPYYDPRWGSQNISGYGDSSTYLDEDNQPTQAGMDYGKMAQGAMSGFAAGAANSQPVGDFNVDQYAGFKGSGQGLASGGPIGAIIGGVTAQFGQFKKVNENLKNLDTSVEGVSYDAYGRPVYNSSAFTQANANIGALDKGIKKLNRTHLDPATNLISSFSGTRRRMKRRRGEIMSNIQAAQQNYNQSESDYRNQTMAQQDYYKRLNNNNRMYNVYRSQF